MSRVAPGNDWFFALAACLVLAQAAPLCAQQHAQDVRRQLDRVEQGTRGQPFQPDWDSLGAYRVPAWFRDAKFGIFIHWGVYSVPAFGNEWYPRNMYLQGSPAFQHHVATYGPQSKFGYKDFIPMFRGRAFRRRCLGGSVRARRRALRRSGRRALRRLPHVRLGDDRLGRRQDGAEARRGRRAGGGHPQARAAFRRLLASRRALVVVRRRHEVRLRRARPALRRPLRPGAAHGAARRRRLERAGPRVISSAGSRRTRPSSTTGWRAARSSSTNTIPTFSISTGGSASPRSSPI